MRFIDVCLGFYRSGSSKVYTDKDVLERSGHTLVPATGRVARLDRLLDTHRHVGSGLYLLRDGVRQATLSGHKGRGRTVLDLQDARLAYRRDHAGRDELGGLRRAQSAQVSALRLVHLLRARAAPRRRRYQPARLLSQVQSEAARLGQRVHSAQFLLVSTACRLRARQQSVHL